MIMIILFLFIIGFLIYRYRRNQRVYLTTLTRTIYDTLQRNPSIHQGIDRFTLSGAPSIAYVYK